jgi:hypothetical protein
VSSNIEFYGKRIKIKEIRKEEEVVEEEKQEEE